MPLAPHLLHAAYEFAAPSLTPTLLTRLPQETHRLLTGTQRLPYRLVEAVALAGDRALLESMMAGVQPGNGRREALVSVLRRHGPALATSLYALDQVSWPRGTLREVRRAVLTAAAEQPDHPAWRAPSGLVPALLATTEPALLVPALRAPFPEVVRHALATLLPDVDILDQYTACQALLAHGGEEQLATLAGLPGLALGVQRMAARPDRLTVPGEQPIDHLTHELRLLDPLYVYEFLDLVNEEGLDWTTTVWPALLATHLRAPLPDAWLHALWRVPGCPDELLLDAYAGVNGHAGVNRRLPTDMPNPLPWEVLTSERYRKAGNPNQVPSALRRGVSEGWFPVERVLAEVRPAHSVLSRLPRTPDVREALAELVAPLGDDTGAWLALLRQLGTFPGSCADLVTAAVEWAPAHRGGRGGKRASDAFLRLLASAAEPTQRALLPLLRPTDLRRLFLTHEVSDTTRDHILDLLGVDALPDLAARTDHSGTTTRAVAYLFRQDVPEVNAALFAHQKLSADQRRALLAGVPQRPDGSGPIPLDGKVVARVRDRLPHLSKPQRRRYLLEAVECGDPELLRVVWGTVTLHTPAAQLALLVRLWERHGPDEVRALLAERAFPGRRAARHPLPAKLHKLTRAALDGGEGLALLRARWEAERAPAGKVAFLRAYGGRSLSRAVTGVTSLLEESAPDPLPWSELLASHRTDPLPEPLLAALAEQPDCPEELASPAHLAWARLRLGGSVADGTDPRPGLVELLRQCPLDLSEPTLWLRRVLAHGLLTPREVLHEVRPATRLLHLFGASDLSNRHLAAVRWEARRLAVARLGDDTDAWVMAIMLFPDFSGTFAELLATAVAVAS